MNDNSWSESAITWNLQPTNIGNLLAEHNVVKKAWNDIAFNSSGVSAVENALGGNLSLKVSNPYTSGVTNYTQYYSSEDATHKPELVIEGTNLKSAKAILDFTSDADMRIYPNPMQTGYKLIFELSGFENETEATISIMDISGRIAYSTNVQTQDIASQEIQISLDGVSAGMYMVSVRSNNKKINQRLIVK